MNPSIDSKRFARLRSAAGQGNRAFTFIELLVIVAILGLLALMVVPGLAGVQHKGGRMQCAVNLRQIGMASMIYANDFNHWLPIWGGYDVAHPVNYIRQAPYCRYTYWGAPATNVPVRYVPPTSTKALHNLGYLYAGNFAGDGRSFYCPSQWGTPVGANAYQPLLTTDSTGIVRSSYLYNPRLVNAASGTVSDMTRRYQRTSQLEPHKLFAVDYIAQSPLSGRGQALSEIPHVRERGWNVLFSDSSVQFSRDGEAYILITVNLVTEDSVLSRRLYDTIFDKLELPY